VLEARYRLHVHVAAFSLAALILLPGAGHADANLPHVTVITDSVGAVLQWDGESNTILSQGFDVDLEPLTCRKLASPGCTYLPPPPSALDTIDELGTGLGKTVVIDVGYNDTPETFGAGIDPVMQALVGFGVEHVIWVTLVERLSEWADSNAELVAAAQRWPQLTIADWNAVALPHPEWFADDAHIGSSGGRALAAFLHPFLVWACGAACAPPTAYCGLARTVNGFDYVQATGLGCAAARVITVAIERNDRGPWTCARNVDGVIELTCTHTAQKIELLERSPVPAKVEPGGVVTLSNWSFRLHGAVLQGRQDALGWLSLGRAPWCIPDIPREALLALPLKSVTPDGGCFGPR
jgi:hypothetical protein